MYTRTRSAAQGPITGSYKSWVWDSNGNPLVEGRTNPVSLNNRKLSEKTTSDCEVPGFHRRRAAGEVFVNPFHQTSTVIQFSQGSYHSEIWQDDRRTGQTVPYGMPQTIVDGSGLMYVIWWLTQTIYSPPQVNVDSAPLRISAGNSALADVNSTEFNAPLFIVEWQKTKGLYADICDLFYKQMSDAHRKIRGKRAFLPPTLRNLAQAWLIARFAITPLLYELQGAVAVLSKPLPVRRTARGTSRVEREASKTVWNSDGFGPDPSKFAVRWDRKVECVVRNGLLYESELTSFNKLASLGITRPATVLWELIPFSFVLDRFINIGTWLDAIQPAGLTRTLAAWESIETTVTDHYFTTGAVQRSGLYGTRTRNASYTLDFKQVSKTKTRTPWDAKPAFPRWDPYFNLRHAGDYAALLTQKLRGMR